VRLYDLTDVLHRRLQTRTLPGLFQIMHTNITRTGCVDTYNAYTCLHTHRRTSSVQCSEKIHFPQLHINCIIAKSCPGTHAHSSEAPMMFSGLFVYRGCKMNWTWLIMYQGSLVFWLPYAKVNLS